MWFRPRLFRTQRFQFSIRKLLVIAVLFSIGFAWTRSVFRDAKRQEVARLWVESQRGDYWFEPNVSTNASGPRANPSFRYPMWLVYYLGTDLFVSVEGVLLETEEIYDVEPLVGFSGLKELYINQFVHDEVDFASLRSLSNLERVYFSRWSGMEPERLAELARQLPDLEITSEEYPDYRTTDYRTLH